MPVASERQSPVAAGATASGSDATTAGRSAGVDTCGTVQGTFTQGTLVQGIFTNRAETSSEGIVTRIHGVSNGIAIETISTTLQAVMHTCGLRTRDIVRLSHAAPPSTIDRNAASASSPNIISVPTFVARACGRACATASDQSC